MRVLSLIFCTFFVEISIPVGPMIVCLNAKKKKGKVHIFNFKSWILSGIRKVGHGVWKTRRSEKKPTTLLVQKVEIFRCKIFLNFW